MQLCCAASQVCAGLFCMPVECAGCCALTWCRALQLCNSPVLLSTKKGNLHILQGHHKAVAMNVSLDEQYGRVVDKAVTEPVLPS